MPIMIVQYGWTHDFASYLGSANLLGYLVGALLALFSIKENLYRFDYNFGGFR